MQSITHKHLRGKINRKYAFSIAIHAGEFVCFLDQIYFHLFKEAVLQLPLNEF